MTEKTYVVVQINKDNETHRFPCEVVKLNESAQTADVKFKDGVVYNDVPYALINEGVGDLWNKIKSGAQAIGARFKKIGGQIVSFVNGVIAAAIGPVQAAFNFQSGKLPKSVVVIPSDETIASAKEEGIELSKNLDKLDANKDVESEKLFIQNISDFWTLIKEQHEAKGGEISESERKAIYWKTLSARRNMQLNEGLLKPADIIMPISVKQEQIDLINTGAINEGYLFESDEMAEIEALFNVEAEPTHRRPGSGNIAIPSKTLDKLKSKKHSEVPDVYYDELVSMLRRDMTERIRTSFRDEFNGALTGTRPICIWGAPAIGKTAVINQLIKNELPSEKLDTISLTASMLYRDDFMLPATSEDSARDLPKSWLPCFHMKDMKVSEEEKLAEYEKLDAIANGSEKGKKGGVIFVDEFSRITPEAMTVFMTLVPDRHLNSQFRLGSKWMFVMAANRPEDLETGQHAQSGQTFTWDDAWSGRFEHVNYVPEFENWLAWAEKAGLEKTLLDFVKENPKYWFDTLDHENEDDGSLNDELADTGYQMMRSDQRGIAHASKKIQTERQSKRMEFAAQMMVKEWTEKVARLLKQRKEEAAKNGTEVDMAAFQEEAYAMMPWAEKEANWKVITSEEIQAWIDQSDENVHKAINNVDLTSRELTSRVKSHMGTTAGEDFEKYLKFYRFFPASYGRMVWTDPDNVPIDNPTVTLASHLNSMVHVIKEQIPDPKDSMNPDEFTNLVKFILRLAKIQVTAASVFMNYFFGTCSSLINNYIYGSNEAAAGVSVKERTKKMLEVYKEGINLLNSDKSAKEISKTLQKLMSTNITDSVNKEMDAEEARRNKIN